MMVLSCHSKYQCQKDINPIVVKKIDEHIKYIQDEVKHKKQSKMLICVYEKVVLDTSFVTIEYIDKKYYLDNILKEFHPTWQIISDSLAIIGFENKTVIQSRENNNLNLIDFIPKEEAKYLTNEYYPVELIFVKGEFVKTRVSDLQFNPFWQAFERHNPPPKKFF